MLRNTLYGKLIEITKFNINTTPLAALHTNCLKLTNINLLVMGAAVAAVVIN